MRNPRAFVIVCAGSLGLALLLPRPAAAAWPTDPAVNVPLCTTSGNQDQPTSVSDGASGAIVTWVDYRGGTGDIYVQRISPAGDVLWTANGVALCAAAGDQYAPTLVADGTGGAIVFWADGRSGTYDIYTQRISAAGAAQWTANGVALCVAAGSQWAPVAVADGVGGAVVSWVDGRSGTNNDDIYAQRISADGAALWTTGGVALCSAAGAQGGVSIAPDGASGAVVAWDDYRSASNYDIYAQRILAAGTVQWTANGVALCTAAGGQYAPTVVSDDAGAAIVSWYDQRSGTCDIYAQRVSSAGAVSWTANGVALCAAAGDQYYPVAVADGVGGAIVTWFALRSGGYAIYAQRISSAGAVQWTANGAALCTSGGTQWYPAIVADGSGGAIVAWTDARGTSYDVYAQRISIGGAVQWTANGVALCTATGLQEPGAVVADGSGGAFAAWVDGRNATFDIYAQHVLATGQLGGTVGVPDDAAPPLAFALEPVRPNPSRGGTLMVRFTLASPTAASVELLDVAGRLVAAREVGSLGAGSHALDLGQGGHLAPGRYLVRLRQGASVRVTRVAVLR